MVNINIIFDRLDRTYSSGDRINLEVHIQVNSNKKVNSIYARFRGLAHVGWMDSREVRRDGKMHTEWDYYHADETFFNHSDVLAGGPNIQLQTGIHIFNTSFQLPRNLPQTHKVDVGYIKYDVKVHLNVSWGFDDKEKVAFFVRPRLDLNEFPDLQRSVRVLAYKTFGFCCFQSQPLQIFNVLPRRGFVPGDRIQYALELNNDSDVSIYRATVKLVEKIVYKTYSPASRTNESKRTLWQYEFNSDGNLVACMQNKVFVTDLYFNPAWNFHFFNGCRIISVEYYLKSEAYVSGCHTNLTNYTTITMGTIPFGNYATY